VGRGDHHAGAEQRAVVTFDALRSQIRRLSACVAAASRCEVGSWLRRTSCADILTLCSGVCDGYHRAIIYGRSKQRTWSIPRRSHPKRLRGELAGLAEMADKELHTSPRLLKPVGVRSQQIKDLTKFPVGGSRRRDHFFPNSTHGKAGHGASSRPPRELVIRARSLAPFHAHH